MNRNIIIVVCVGIAFMSSGCAGDCVKIGGGYNGIEGQIQYCFDKETSKETNIPTLTDSDGKKLFGLEEQQIQKIVDKLKESLGIVEKKEIATNAMIELCKLVPNLNTKGK